MRNSSVKLSVCESGRDFVETVCRLALDFVASIKIS